MLETDDLTHEHIADALMANGYAIVPDYINMDSVASLRASLHQLQRDDALRRAGVGQGGAYELRDEIRGDYVHWIDPENVAGATQQYLQRLEALRLELNRSLTLGLFEFEGHFARYPAGTFYRRHLDQFQQDSHRTLTCILYLNEDWRAEEGGQLRMYLNEDDPDTFIDVLPSGGTLVTFLSSRFWHEVLPAARDRLSLTGWFKTRS